MTTSILRPSESWWVHTPTGAARVTTTADGAIDLGTQRIVVTHR